MILEHLTLAPSSTSLLDTSAIDLPTIQAFAEFQFNKGQLNAPIPGTNLRCYAAAHDDGTAFFWINYQGQTLTNNICCFREEAFQKAQYLLTELLSTLHHRLALDGQLPRQSPWLYSVPIDQTEVDLALLQQADQVAVYIYDALYRAQQTN